MRFYKDASPTEFEKLHPCSSVCTRRARARRGRSVVKKCSRQFAQFVSKNQALHPILERAGVIWPENRPASRRFVAKASRVASKAKRFVLKAKRVTSKAKRFVVKAKRFVAKAKRVASKAKRFVVKAKRVASKAKRFVPFGGASVPASRVASAGYRKKRLAGSLAPP